MSGGGGSSQPATQTVTQTQQIPQFEQDFSQSNQNLANSLGSTPFPAYQAPLLAGMDPRQLQSIAGVQDVANSYQPQLNQATQVANNAGNTGAGIMNTSNSYLPYLEQMAGQSGNQAIQGLMGAGAAEQQQGQKMLNLNPANSATVSQFMSPYWQNALAPQLQQLNTQYGQQQNALNAQSTQANAFGDARQGVAQSLNNYYNNLATSGVMAQGANSAYNSALNTIQGQQGLGANLMGMGNSAYGNAGSLQQAQTGLQNQILTGQQGVQLQEQGQQLQQSQQLASLAKQYQDQGLTANQALFAAGQALQQQQQQGLNLQYQQFENQANWPYQQLSVRESALSNSPYNMVNAVTLPGANQNTQNLNAFASLLGMGGGGGLFGGSLPTGTH